MAEHKDSELIKIVTILRNDYQPLAVTAAEEELKKRQIDFLELLSKQTDTQTTNEQLRFKSITVQNGQDNRQAKDLMVNGAILFCGSTVLTYMSFSIGDAMGYYRIFWGGILVGVFQFIRGVYKLFYQ